MTPAPFVHVADAPERAAPPALPPLTQREIGRLRTVAQRSQLAPRFDLDRLAAAPETAPTGEKGGAIWGVALLQAVARGRPITFHRREDATATGSECWLGALLAALRAGDTASARFLVERHVRAEDRRLALCFAQRLVGAGARNAGRGLDPTPHAATF